MRSSSTVTGLAGGLHSVKDIAAATKMSEKQTMGAIASLCRRGLCEKRKTGSYWITKEGRAKLRAEKKALKK